MSVPPVVAEATRRGSVVWVALDGARPRPVWHVWHDGRDWVLVDGGGGGVEQRLDGAATATWATVAVRSKERQSGLLVTWVAEVDRVPPGSPEWEAVAPLLAAARLNAPDGPHQVVRWETEALLLRLTPTGELLDAP